MKTRILTALALLGALTAGVAQTISNPSFEANSKRTNRFLAIVAVLGLWGACSLKESATS